MHNNEHAQRRQPLCSNLATNKQTCRVAKQRDCVTARSTHRLSCCALGKPTSCRGTWCPHILGESPILQWCGGFTRA
eukprot:5074602-Pyramimonas_sp.AAC.1